MCVCLLSIVRINKSSVFKEQRTCDFWVYRFTSVEEDRHHHLLVNEIPTCLWCFAEFCQSGPDRCSSAAMDLCSGVSRRCQRVCHLCSPLRTAWHRAGLLESHWTLRWQNISNTHSAFTTNLDILLITIFFWCQFLDITLKYHIAY